MASEEEKMKKKRSPRWSMIEIDELLKFVKENRASLFGTACHSSANVEKVKSETWKNCCNNVNAVGAWRRDWQAVRKKWQDLASEARKYNQMQTKTGKLFQSVLVKLIYGTDIEVSFRWRTSR